ncbi:hypothetical protein ACOMHN_017552 [Nucella lapillus]
MACTKNAEHLFASSAFPLLMLLVLAGSLRASSPGAGLRETSLRRLPPDDVLYTEDLLLETSARSRIECSIACAETEGCAMGTFLSRPPGGSPGHCRLHSRRQSAADGMRSWPRARSVGKYPDNQSGRVD